MLVASSEIDLQGVSYIIAFAEGSPFRFFRISATNLGRVGRQPTRIAAPISMILRLVRNKLYP